VGAFALGERAVRIAHGLIAPLHKVRDELCVQKKDALFGSQVRDQVVDELQQFFIRAVNIERMNM
jgi:hypothetical protein